MSSEWLYNLAGLTLTEEQMASFPNPRLEVTLHVTFKAIQAFGFLGFWLFGPLIHFFSTSEAGIAALATSNGLNGVLVGLVVGPIMSLVRLSTQTEDAILDRCKRLRRNRMQLKVDRGFVVGSVAGVLAGLVLGHPRVGFLLGMCFGVIAGALISGKGAKSK